jgi:hypothetical protein
MSGFISEDTGDWLRIVCLSVSKNERYTLNQMPMRERCVVKRECSSSNCSSRQDTLTSRGVYEFYV